MIPKWSLLHGNGGGTQDTIFDLPKNQKLPDLANDQPLNFWGLHIFDRKNKVGTVVSWSFG